MLIKEAALAPSWGRKMSLEDLNHLIEKIESKLEVGTISTAEYDSLSKAIMSAAGWTPQEYEDAIDQRWDTIEHERAVAPKPMARA